LASAWTLPSIPLVLGANVITVTATAGSTAVAKSITVVRQAAPTGPSDGMPDTTAPTLTVTFPASPTMSTAATSVVLKGTASDNVGVSAVSWSTNFGTAGTATGTNSWSATVTVLIGNTTITVRATDFSGNVSWRTVVVMRH
jgi:hypothetical protein